MKIEGTKEELIKFRNKIKLDKIIAFKLYLERKVQREPYPHKNMVNDCLSRFKKEFQEEIKFHQKGGEHE